MLRLMQAPHDVIAMVWVDLLCEAGMPASVQRQYLSGAVGHLPPGECLPEVWLEYPEHEARALCWTSSTICRSGVGGAAAASASRVVLSSAGSAALSCLWFERGRTCPSVAVGWWCYFQRTGSTQILPWVLLSVNEPSWMVACSCMLRSAMLVSACDVSAGMRQT